MRLPCRVNTFFIFELFSLTMFRFIIREEEYWFLVYLELLAFSFL